MAPNYGDFFRTYPLIDAAIWLVFVIAYFKTWADVRSESSCVQERTLGMTAVVGQFNAIILAGTIAVGFIGAIGASLLSNSIMPEPMQDHVRVAIGFGFLSILAGISGLGIINRYITNHNVALVRSIAVCGVAAFLFLIIALFRTVFGLAQLL